MNWRDRARCRGVGDALFFPIGTDGDRVSESAEAAQQDAKRRFCYQCPVAAECLTSALANGEAYGVFASTPQERRGIRKELRRSAREHELYNANRAEPVST